MTLIVRVQQTDGQLTVTVVGAPDISATAPTLSEAFAALNTTIQHRLAQGELVAMEVGLRGVIGLAGKYRDDPTLREICKAAYQRRDSEGAA